MNPYQNPEENKPPYQSGDDHSVQGGNRFQRSFNGFHPSNDLVELRHTVGAIKKELAKIIIGQETFIDLLIIAILSDGHVLIEGVPGVAKTLTAKLLSKTIATGFSRIQFTPDLMPSDVLGTSVYNFNTSEFKFKSGPIFSNIILIDEINRAPAKTQAALFEVMEEKQITIDGKEYTMEAPFMVLATQNPVEQEGTYRLPEAQLDRFLFKIEVHYPSLEEEVEIIGRFHANNNRHQLEDIQEVLQAGQIERFRKEVNNIHVDAILIQYIGKVVHNTRNHRDLYLGASPRASLAILSSAKAYAAMQGRDFVIPEDIQKVTLPVLRHRIIVSAEKEMEGKNADDVVHALLQEIEVPR